MSLTDTVALDNIIGITHAFQQHADQLHRQAHHMLKTQCAANITETNDTLSAKDKDIPELITAKAIERMSDQQSDQRKFL